MEGEGEEGSGRVQASFRLSWKWLAMFAVTGLIFYVLIDRLSGADQLAEVLARTDLGLASLALGIVLFNLCLAAARWALIVRAMSYPLRVGRAFGVILATRPFDLFVPSRGNDFLRFLGVRDIVPPMEASGSVLAQRVIDVQSICIYGLLGSVVAEAWGWTALLGVGLVAGWGVVALLFWQRERFVALPLVRRFEGKWRKLFLAFAALRDRPGHLLGVIALSMIAWFQALLIIWILSAATNADLAFGSILAYWPLSIFVGMLPLTVAGMGTRDAAFLGLVNASAAAPVSAASLVAVTLGYSVTSNLFPSLIGIPFMLYYMRRIGQLSQEEGEEGSS